MDNSPLRSRPDYLVCTCFGVMYSEIKQAVANGCDDFEKLQENLMVGTGCSSCVDEVCEILAEELGARKKQT